MCRNNYRSEVRSFKCKRIGFKKTRIVYTVAYSTSPAHTAETHACSVLRISRDFLIYIYTQHQAPRVVAKTLGVYFLAWRNAHGFPENYIS